MGLDLLRCLSCRGSHYQKEYHNIDGYACGAFSLPGPTTRPLRTGSVAFRLQQGGMPADCQDPFFVIPCPGAAALLVGGQAP